MYVNSFMSNTPGYIYRTNNCFSTPGINNRNPEPQSPLLQVLMCPDGHQADPWAKEKERRQDARAPEIQKLANLNMGQDKIN